MRQVIYAAAASLDGYIARLDGSVDWIPQDPDMDLGALASRFDVLLMGRKTFDVSRALVPEGEPNPLAGFETYVFSRAEPAGRRHDAEYTATSPGDLVRDLRKHPGKDLWLMGGGELVAEFLKADLVDGISVSICPVLLGRGVPMFGMGFPQRGFRLAAHRAYPKSGIVSLDFERA